MSTSTAYKPTCDNTLHTCAELVALRDAGLLVIDCHYRADVPAQGNLGPTIAELHAVTVDMLSLEAKIHTTWDNEAWEGILDVDQCKYLEVRDQLGNTVREFQSTFPSNGNTIANFDWGNARWQDNLVENSIFTGLPVAALPQVHNSQFIDTTMDFTGWVSGSVNETMVRGSGVHHITGTFSSWNRSTIDNATLNFAGRSTINDSQIREQASITTVGVATPANFTLFASTVEDQAVINDQSTGTSQISINRSRIAEAAQVQREAGSTRAFTLADSFLGGRAIVRIQPGSGVIASFSISGSEVRGAPGGVGPSTIRVLGDQAVTIGQCDLQLAGSIWTIDGPGAPTSFNCNGSKFIQTAVTVGPAAGRTDFSGSQFVGCQITHNGSGSMNLGQCNGNNGSIIQSVAGTSGALSVQQAVLNQATISIDSGPRSLAVIRGQCDQFSSVRESSTTPASNPSGDQIDTCHLDGNAQIQLACTAAGAFGNLVSRTRIRGGSLGSDGLVRFEGLTDHVWVDGGEILGTMTFTDVPNGALSTPQAVEDIHLDQGCIFHYTAGDATPKQIRNNRISGLSQLICTNLTGGAGSLLADVFDCDVSGQSVMTVDGARVPGQPVRNVRVETGSILNVEANGTMLQCRVALGATVNSGPFRSSETEVSLPGPTTFTAPNVNKLRNKAYSDVV